MSPGKWGCRALASLSASSHICITTPAYSSRSASFRPSTPSNPAPAPLVLSIVRLLASASCPPQYRRCTVCSAGPISCLCDLVQKILATAFLFRMSRKALSRYRVCCLASPLLFEPQHALGILVWHSAFGCDSIYVRSRNHKVEPFFPKLRVLYDFFQRVPSSWRKQDHKTSFRPGFPSRKIRTCSLLGPLPRHHPNRARPAASVANWVMRRTQHCAFLVCHWTVANMGRCGVCHRPYDCRAYRLLHRCRRAYWRPNGGQGSDERRCHYRRSYGAPGGIRAPRLLLIQHFRRAPAHETWDMLGQDGFTTGGRGRGLVGAGGAAGHSGGYGVLRADHCTTISKQACEMT